MQASCILQLIKYVLKLQGKGDQLPKFVIIPMQNNLYQTFWQQN